MNTIHVSFEDLKVILCNASNKRKVKKPIFGKLTYETIPVFYEKWGYIFRKDYGKFDITPIKDRKYYSMEEMQELFKKYVENIH